MTIEHASILVVDKPWGRTDLSPWNDIECKNEAIGEIWFQRSKTGCPEPKLLLKLLFTSQALSIQVHPDDEYARSIGLPNGKTEAWYVLSAARRAEVAIGLLAPLTASQLRDSIEDQSIAGLVNWMEVSQGDVVFVPAGTIHAIGAGLVIAEIQQRSDSTFRLFDQGRSRQIHVADSVAVARAGPAGPQAAFKRLTRARTLLVACDHFVFERVEFMPNSTWVLQAEQETWFLVLSGHASFGDVEAAIGEGIFFEDDRAAVCVGETGLTGLIAYLGPAPDVGLFKSLDSGGAKARTLGAERRFALDAGAADAPSREKLESTWRL